uniref:Putative chromatin assembly complex 1 subunit b/cac2 n=1 Tax=Panstrongylus lignarius TaxID=156445 RepID=A0A224XQF3_9HEMI
MKCIIPEISWHNRDPVLSVDVQRKKDTESFYRLASGGIDAHVLIWHMTQQENGALRLDCVCDLARHQKSVNVVKFSPSGEFLASGDDESYIIIWKQKTDYDITDLTEEEERQDSLETKEQWIQVRVLRGHLNDIYDLCWSPDSIHLISGSVDNSAIIWDLTKGKKVALLPEAKNFVQGVTWDPENMYVATLSSDGTCRIYNWRTHKMVAAISKAKVHRQSQMESVDVFKNIELSTQVGNTEGDKPTRLFHDDTLKSFFRRLAFSPDGSLLAAPSGCLPESPDVGATKNATWIFLRRKPSSPVLHYPSLNQPTMVTKWCPLIFTLREEVNSPVFTLPYRMVLAVATKTTILLYDTQHAVPIAMISNIHYTKLTDLAWSSDGKILIASSTDGYCSIITFSDGELGNVYVQPKSEEAIKSAV